MSAVLWAAMIAVFGVGITPYLVIQAVVGFSLLEVVNYMEHYGMLRQKVGVGERQRYERVDPSHSWNSNNIATNVLLYHLQRHSDHHANPTRRYQSLRDYEESPVLPTGYAGMIVLAIVPAVWRRVMDPRVLAHFGGDVTPRQHLPAQAGARSSRRYGAAGPAGDAEEPSGLGRRVGRAASYGETAAAAAAAEPLDVLSGSSAPSGRERRGGAGRGAGVAVSRAAATPTTWSWGRSGRASRPGRRGRRSPTPGAAPTAGCGRRSTSSRSSSSAAS